MTKRFSITANGTEMGTYEGETEQDAIKAYVNDAGYETIESAADACGQDVDEFLADISTEEVTNE